MRITLPHHGPMVILPKHQYWTDIPIISLAFKPLLYFVAKKELFRYPLIRNYLSLLGGLPVDRKQSIRTLDSFRTLFSLLRAGEKIVIFPEGTYFRNEVGSGRSRLLQMILKFQSELGYLIPFVPVGIRYGERSRWRRRVQVCIGPPLFAEKESDAIPLTRQAMGEISRLCRLPRQSSEFGVKSSEIQDKTLRTPNSLLRTILDKEENMPRRERDREIARRRKRKKESKKLRAKGLLETPVGSVKESEKKKQEKASMKETPQEGVEKTTSEG